MERWARKKACWSLHGTNRGIGKVSHEVTPLPKSHPPTRVVCTPTLTEQRIFPVSQSPPTHHTAVSTDDHFRGGTPFFLVIPFSWSEIEQTGDPCCREIRGVSRALAFLFHGRSWFVGWANLSISARRCSEQAAAAAAAAAEDALFESGRRKRTRGRRAFAARLNQRFFCVVSAAGRGWLHKCLFIVQLSKAPARAFSGWLRTERLLAAFLRSARTAGGAKPQAHTHTPPPGQASLASLALTLLRFRLRPSNPPSFAALAPPSHLSRPRSVSLSLSASLPLFIPRRRLPRRRGFDNIYPTAAPVSGAAHSSSSLPAPSALHIPCIVLAPLFTPCDRIHQTGPIHLAVLTTCAPLRPCTFSPPERHHRESKSYRLNETRPCSIRPAPSQTRNAPSFLHNTPSPRDLGIHLGIAQTRASTSPANHHFTLINQSPHHKNIHHCMNSTQ